MPKGMHSGVAWMLALAATIASISIEEAPLFAGLFVCTALICGAIEKAGGDQ